jgi:hypothetical protein
LLTSGKQAGSACPSEADVWWGKVNIPLDAASFAINRERVGMFRAPVLVNCNALPVGLLRLVKLIFRH